MAEALGPASRWFRTAIALLFAIFILSSGRPGYAQQRADAPPSEPILRLNSIAHTASIQRIATDRENRYAVTASLDKTARVWSLPDGQLQTVLRVPIGDGDIGKVYAVAMTPDGNTVALGGRMSVSGAQESIYLFDRTSGVMQRRFSGLPNLVIHLAYSSDGNLLVAGLWGPNGIRVYDVSRGYEPLPSDKDYGDSAYWADFDRRGRLVTTSDDGFVRLYAAGRYESPIAKVKVRGVNDPLGAAFSPGGKRVAVADYNSPAIMMLSGENLAFLHAMDTSGVAAVNIDIPAWSADGRYLFAGGQAGAGKGGQVFRWGGDGTGRHIDIEPANDTIQDLQPLKNGGILFASADPAFGIIDERSHAKMLHGPGQLVFRSRLGSLRVSKAGQTVETGTNYPQHTIRFALAERRLDTDPPADNALVAPVTEAQGLKVTDWHDGYHPAVNGRPIALDSYEKSRSLAFLPGNDGFVLGTDWWVRRYDRDGKLVWREPAPGVTWDVNVTPDGRLAVTAHGDGTIRWRRASDGQELLALFVHPDGKRWIAWTPQGYYDASAGAEDLIGWQVNHGFDRAPDFFPVSRFRDRFYRPDVIAKVLDTLDVKEAVKQADTAAGRPTAKAAPVTAILPPVVRIADPTQTTTVTDTDFKVTYAARTPADDPVTRVEVEIDGRNTKATEQVLASGSDARVGILTITLPRSDATVSVIAYNSHGPSEPAAVRVLWAGRGSEPKPKLYVLAIGVGNYQDQSLNLRYPAKDANDFVNTIKEHAAGLYENVIVNDPPPGGKWTHDAVLDGLDWVRREPTNKDVAMIFISGHGVVTPDQVYRFLPYDYDPARIERTTVRSVDFEDFLSKIGGKVLLFLDTCYSGDVYKGGKAPVQVSVDKFANELSAADHGVVVFASSTGNQLSWEDPAWGNGAFTKALDEGLAGAADSVKAGVVRVIGLEGYIYDRVKILTHGDQKPMVAIPKMVENFPIVLTAQ